MTAFGRPVEIERRRFPALDPEPPPRRWYERAARFATVVAVAGAVAAGVVFVVRVIGHSGRPAAPIGPVTGTASRVGRVALVSTDGSVALSDVDGTHLTTLHSLRRYPDQLLALSIDGRYLVASDGTIIAVQGGGVSIQQAHAVVTTQQMEAMPDPLANRDQDLIVGPASSIGLAPWDPFQERIFEPVHFAGTVSAIPFGTGKPVGLGIADAAAGDPQQVGAFVSVPSGESPHAAVNEGVPAPDARVELRDVGRPAVILATADSLNSALGQKPGGRVSLVPFPTPDGDRVAITVTDASEAGTSEGIVVLDRSGHVQYTLSAGSAPEAGQALAWSPDGRSLAFMSQGSTSSDVVVWVPGQRPLIRADPTPDDVPIRCLWAPDASAVLCATQPPDGSVDWNVAGARGGPVVAITARGLPVAWLPRSP